MTEDAQRHRVYAIQCLEMSCHMTDETDAKRMDLDTALAVQVLLERARQHVQQALVIENGASR